MTARASGPRCVLAALAYPLVMAATLATGGVCLLHDLPEWISVGASGFVAGLLALVLEHVLPYRRAWLSSHGDVRTDVLHAVVNNPVIAAVNGAVVGLVTMASVWLSAHLAFGLWPRGGSPWLHLPFALVVAEIGGYTLHRLQHRMDSLVWRFHAIHHSVPRLYFLNGLRVHIADGILTTLTSTVPLALLGVDAHTMILVGIYVSGHLIMQHANIDVRLGPLNWIFSMAEVHRWHHSRRLDEANANYGTVLLVWDVVFRTRYFPTDRVVEPEDVAGLDRPQFPTTFLGQLKAPFQRRHWS